MRNVDNKYTIKGERFVAEACLKRCRPEGKHTIRYDRIVSCFPSYMFKHFQSVP